MFHRVKSEVSESGQKSQPQFSAEESNSEYAAPSLAQEESTSEVKEEREESPFRSYEKTLTPATQKENTMEETNVQGKYSRDTESRNDSPVTGYSRPSAHAPVSRPSAYMPTYGVGASSAAPAVAAQTPASSAYTPSAYAPSAPAASDFSAVGDRCLRIGRGINMSGEIDACDHLLVEGTVEAALKGAKVLEIAESGTFYGTVEIEEATIAGRFEGDITVNGRLTISATGTITGSIAYRELEVQAGAMVDGRMTPLKTPADALKSSEAYRSGSDASAMAKAKDAMAKKDVANNEHGLFSKAHAGR